MKEIVLANGGTTIVDDEDFEFLSSFRWLRSSRSSHPYAIRYIKQSSGKWTVVRMHRLIMNPSRDMLVDHANGDGLDNRRCNLRVCTNGENSWNRRKSGKTTSQYKGVWFEGKRWKARIKRGSDYVYLGRFINERDAALAYNEAAIRLHGAFANLNPL